MAGRHKWEEVRDRRRTPAVVALEQEAESGIKAELAAYQHTLGELRRARTLTHEQLARSMEVGQTEITRIERQAELYFSTLQRFVAALGGRLELTAIFDDRPFPIALDDLTPDAAETGSLDAAE